MADRKSRQMLRRVKEINPESILVACGCYVQGYKEELEKIEEIDIIIGNNMKKNIVDDVEKFIRDNKNITDISDVMSQNEFAEFGVVTYTEKTRAVIKIQDGCDRFCSYCIIPYARGRVRSRKIENIIKEIQEIVQKGIKEVVITGIHIASYGKDFKENIGLIDLLEKINDIEGLERIRLGSLEPTLIKEEFVKRLKQLKKVCNHFHLSLQSACDETLERMNRKYNVEEFKQIVHLLRENFNDVVLTTDIIVGFPGETDDNFEETCANLKQIGFYKMHIFKYSPRKGTKAAVMPGQISSDIKQERSKRLISMSDENEVHYNKSYLGKEIEVLFEEIKDGSIKGHTKNYIMVKVESDDKNLENKIKEVKVTGVTNLELLGAVKED